MVVADGCRLAGGERDRRLVLRDEHQRISAIRRRRELGEHRRVAARHAEPDCRRHRRHAIESQRESADLAARALVDVHLATRARSLRIERDDLPRFVVARRDADPDRARRTRHLHQRTAGERQEVGRGDGVRQQHRAGGVADRDDRRSRRVFEREGLVEHAVAGRRIGDAQLSAVREVRHLVEAVAAVLEGIVDGGRAVGDLLAVFEDRQFCAEVERVAVIAEAA